MLQKHAIERSGSMAYGSGSGMAAHGSVGTWTCHLRKEDYFVGQTLERGGIKQSHVLRLSKMVRYLGAITVGAALASSSRAVNGLYLLERYRVNNR
jgi:hypothetical protein